jgi:hypothetical protein
MYREPDLIANGVPPGSLDAKAAAAPRAPARLLEYARGRFVALPTHTTLELLEHPAILAVPGGAYYGYGLLAWQGQQIPVLNFDALLRAYAGAIPAAAPRYALVIAYQQVPRGPVRHGALGLAALPRTVEVGDETGCELPEDGDLWSVLALSCFQYEGQAVPIIDTARLFAAYHG